MNRTASTEGSKSKTIAAKLYHSVLVLCLVFGGLVFQVTLLVVGHDSVVYAHHLEARAPTQASGGKAAYSWDDFDREFGAVTLVNPAGDLVDVPSDKLAEAKAKGYRLETDDEFEKRRERAELGRLQRGTWVGNAALQLDGPYYVLFSALALVPAGLLIAARRWVAWLLA